MSSRHDHRGICAVLVLAMLAMLPTAGFPIRGGAADPPARHLTVGAFSNGSPGTEFPGGWSPLTFDKIQRHTRYDLIDDGGTTVVRATSAASASGMIRHVTIDPQRYPVIRWRWKISNTYHNGDVSRKSGDDYPARLYITFAYVPETSGWAERAKFETARLVYGEYPPVAALNYIWASKAPIGSIHPNPYTDRAMMVVLRSGDSHAGQWMEEQRNILEDYRKAFGGEKVPPVSGIAVMSDSDNTGERAVAYFGDIFMVGED